MDDKIVVVSQPLLKPLKIVKWKVSEGNSISIGCVILLYNIDEEDTKETLKLKSIQAGTVHRIVAQEKAVVKPRETLLELKPCIHPTVMRDMCAECGADLRKEDVVTTASIPMIHTVPELKVSLEIAQKLGKADTERLLKDRKLVLLVDLDQTLIHTTNDNIPPNIKDVHHFQLYGLNSPWYHTRLRPGTHQFLAKMSQLYELHICTFGARNYAHMIAMFLDRDGQLFSHRILSRDECFNPNSKTANLKALFPCGDNMVCIIDDREDVWSYASNLIHVKPYHFFQHTGDINAPPGLDKHEDDEKIGVDLTKLQENQKTINGLNESRINDKDEETKLNEESTKNEEKREENNEKEVVETSENSKNVEDSGGGGNKQNSVEMEIKEKSDAIKTNGNSSNETTKMNVNKIKSCGGIKTDKDDVKSDVKENNEVIKMEINDEKIENDQSNKEENKLEVEEDKNIKTTKDKKRENVEVAKTETDKVDVTMDVKSDVKENNEVIKMEINDEKIENDQSNKEESKLEVEEDKSIKTTKDKKRENVEVAKTETDKVDVTIDKAEEREESKEVVIMEISQEKMENEQSSKDSKLEVEENKNIKCNKIKKNENIEVAKVETEKVDGTHETKSIEEFKDVTKMHMNQVKIENQQSSKEESKLDVEEDENSKPKEDKEKEYIEVAKVETDKAVVAANTNEETEEMKKTEYIQIISTSDETKTESKENENKVEDLIEIEDPDDYLLYLEEILKIIHKAFYEKYETVNEKEVPDLKKVIPEVRSTILKGKRLVFSGLVPTHIKLEESKAYQVARSLGAVVTQDLEPETTHLVAVRPGTAKVNAGRRKRNLKIVTPDWLWACAERWEHVDERLYPLNNKGSKNRHPPPHCSSPEHIPNYDEPAIIRKRTPSGRFMDTINPLMSFSSADIADMDREVEDIFNESESEGESSSKKPSDIDRILKTTKETDDESSSSDESLTGDHPHGWNPIRNSKKRSREDQENDFEDESTADEYPSTKFRRGEELSSDLEFGQDSNSEGSAEAPDEIDDGDWNMMGAALEREFLSNN